jgi:predicted dehydrogenase
MKRRNFLKSTAAASLAFSAVPITEAKTSRQYRTALIGTGWWGMNILRTALDVGRSSVVGMCDVDRNQLEPAVDEIEKMTGSRPSSYHDYRELLQQEDPELVIVATPDHWHALCAIAAMESGAHVYVEKPIGHTINEGKAMVAAARKHGRKVQVGTHRRVSPHNISGMEFLKSGGAGEIGMIRSFVHYSGGSGEPTPRSEPPEGLDWDMWCGPAPKRPFNEAIHPKGFRQFLEYANGQIADWGIHWLDHILWWTDEKHPQSVSSTGGRHIKQDSTNAPDTQVATYRFESFTATWEHRFYAGNRAEETNIGCYFYGTEGTFHMGWLDGWTFYPSDDNKEIIHEEPQLNQPDNQNIRGLWVDLLDAVENDRLPVCDIEIGHRSTNMSLLAMLSFKLGRSIEWDGSEVPGDPGANALLRREYREPWEYPEIA